MDLTSRRRTDASTYTKSNHKEIVGIHGPRSKDNLRSIDVNNNNALIKHNIVSYHQNIKVQKTGPTKFGLNDWQRILRLITLT